MIDHTCTAKQAFNLMIDNKITSLPITRHDKMYGVISMSDIKILGDENIDAEEILGLDVVEFVKQSRSYVSKLMNTIPRPVDSVVSCAPDSTLHEVIQCMLAFNLHHIYIVNEGTPVNVISFIDVLRLVV